MFQIIWRDDAAREFDRLPERVRENMYVALARLAACGRGDVKALKGRLAGFHRLRVGKYRLRFHWSREERAIIITAAEPRGSAYED